MIKVTEHPVNLRMELIRLLEIFIKSGSLTATRDRLTDLEWEAIAILKTEGYCVLDTRFILDLKEHDALTVKENDEAKARDEEALALDGIDGVDEEFRFEGKTDEQLKPFLALPTVDGGDINGRFRFVTSKLEEAGVLIAIILRSVKPPTMSK